MMKTCRNCIHREAVQFRQYKCRKMPDRTFFKEEMGSDRSNCVSYDSGK